MKQEFVPIKQTIIPYPRLHQVSPKLLVIRATLVLSSQDPIYIYRINFKIISIFQGRSKSITSFLVPKYLLLYRSLLSTLLIGSKKINQINYKEWTERNFLSRQVYLETYQEVRFKTFHTNKKKMSLRPVNSKINHLKLIIQCKTKRNFRVNTLRDTH